VKNFVDASFSLLASSGYSACDSAIELLGTVDFSFSAKTLATHHREPLACTHLVEAFSSSNAIKLTEDLAAINDQLMWGEAPRGKITSFMDDKHATVRLIGPDAGFISDQLRFGIFLLAPNTTYPLHSHAAEEIYVPISGSGFWRSQESSYVPRQPGSIVHLRPWIPHALRSGTEPLLMIWVWFGEIDFDAYQIEPNAFDGDGMPL
jgi:hypothetical protein